MTGVSPFSIQGESFLKREAITPMAQIRWIALLFG